MILPPTITPAQLDQARALVQVRQERERQLSTLTRRLNQAQSQSQRTHELMTARLDVKRYPERLAGLAEFLQRNHRSHHRRIQSAYRWLLREMIDPLKPFSPADMPALPKPPPLTLDFAALHIAARPYLLGPYLGLHQNGRWAEVDLLRSQPSRGHIVLVQTGGPVDVSLYRTHLPALNAWLTAGDRAGTWTITDHAASSITLTCQPKLPELLPYHRNYLAPGKLFVGVDTTLRTPVHIAFSDLTAGTYVPGASGSGKTSALHVLLRSIFANLNLFSAVYLVDGKDGVAMQRYARLHPKIRVLYDEPDVWQLAADLNVTMRERNTQQRALGTDKAIADFIAVVIDELPTFIADPPKAQQKDHAAFLDNLQRIAMRGRSAGIRMFLISQAPVKEQIPVALRTNCATTIAFRLPEQTHATGIFGELKNLPNDPRKLPTGQAIVLQSDTGIISTVQFPFAELYKPGRFA